MSSREEAGHAVGIPRGRLRFVYFVREQSGQAHPGLNPFSAPQSLHAFMIILLVLLSLVVVGRV